MITYNKKFMIEAIRLAAENVRRNNGGPFGCVITKDNQIIATGVNNVTKNNDPSAHAEIMAIRSACQHLKHHQLNGCGIYSSCEPCPMCLGAIYWARLNAVYYAADKNDAHESGFDDSFIYDEILLQPGSRKILMEQHERKQAIYVFDIWGKSENKETY